MNPFDELTLGEVEDMTKTCLDGKSIADSEPISLAGAVMWCHSKRSQPGLTWEEFRQTTRMAEIKEFSKSMNDEESPENPSNGSMQFVS